MSHIDRALIRTAVKFAAVGQPPSKKARRWNKCDLDRVKQLLPFHSPSVIGNMLNRSADAIKIIRKRHNISASSKSAGWLTANRVRLFLGMPDARPVIGSVKKGFVLGHQITGETTWMIHEISLRRWIISPISWAYFNPARIADMHLARLVRLAQARWGDEWLSTHQVADMKGTNSKAVLQAIVRGSLPAIHLQQKDGRHGRAWAFWAVKRSDAAKWIYKARAYDLMDETHAFILLAIAIGLSAERIGKLCGMSTETLAQRIRKINTACHASKLIRKHKLKYLAFNPSLHGVHADWRKYADQFPYVRRAFKRYSLGSASPDDCYLITRILKVQIAASSVQCKFNALGKCSPETLQRLIARMKQLGINPYLPKR